MANKPTKVTRKKSRAKVRDLAARKDPKGGAQKKEGPAPAGNTRGAIPKIGKSRLS